MGQTWDGGDVSFKKETWEYCFSVLKEGGYLLSFGGSRTYHRIACAIEDAGFEIRDCILWLYGTGFPKSMNVAKGMESKEHFGKAGTRQKRQIEQESEGEGYTINQTKNGCIGKTEPTIRKVYLPITELGKKWEGYGTCLKPAYEPILIARKPFKGSLIDNLFKNGVGAINIDACKIGKDEGRFLTNVILDDSVEVLTSFFAFALPRYFYSAKISHKDREEGLDQLESKDKEEARFQPVQRKNTHPTVKPTELMQYLIRMFCPKGSNILDPFMGSGSTGKAYMFENREREAKYFFIGIEMTEEYLPIAKERILYAKNKYQYYKDETSVVKTLFDYMEDE